MPTNTVPNAKIPLVQASRKIYPKSVDGVFTRARWAMVFITQAIFYLTPWISWNNRQAVLFDISDRQFYIFSWIFYPQDLIYLSLLLMISALSLFLFTTVAGRLWCGYACPQTVYTEIFLWIEKIIEGDRNQRIRLDEQPRSARALKLKSLKLLAWLVLALWTGITFVGYFTPIKPLVVDLSSLSVSFWPAFWVLFYSFATLGNAGFMREQVCKYMCPYARFQGVMFDRDTLIISYDERRGEPRGKALKSANKVDLTKGDCIDCKLCVQVCPVGIDIRDGQQYECIGCAACIDACNVVMDKVGLDRGLVRYDTLNRMEGSKESSLPGKQLLRPRVLVYSTILSLLVVAMIVSLATRVPIKLDVTRDRMTLARTTGGTGIENLFQIKLTNSTEKYRVFDLSVSGLSGIQLESPHEIRVDSASTKTVVARLIADYTVHSAGSYPIEFTVSVVGEPHQNQTAKAVFYVPPGNGKKSEPD